LHFIIKFINCCPGSSNFLYMFSAYVHSVEVESYN
jgi:hypothetical protein